MICIDASVAVKWIFEEQDSDRAQALAVDTVRRGEQLVAPHLLPFEVVNAIHQRARRQTMHAETLNSLIDEFFKTHVELGPRSQRQRLRMHRRGLELATEFGLPATYDAHYLALAEMRRCMLWTADRRLVNAVGDRFPLVRWIGDYTPV